MVVNIVRLIQRFFAVNALVFGALATAAGGASAAGWLPPASAPPSSSSADAQDVALDARGNAVAVWTNNGRWRVTQAATRPVGGSWSAPVALLPDGEEGGWQPHVAVGADGDAVAVWSSVRHSGGTRQIVMAASLQAGGRWSEPVALSDEEGIAVSYEPEVVVDGRGDATAIWSEETGYASAVHASTRPKGGEWSAPVELTELADRVASTPRLAVDPQGDVTAVWNWHVPERGSGVIQTSTRSAAGSWSEPVDLSGEEPGLEPQIAVGPGGEAVAVWYRSSGDISSASAAWRVAGGGWRAAVELAPDDANAYLPQVAIDPQGTATAVWESSDSGGVFVRSSTSAAGGPWSAPVDVSARGVSPWPGSFPQVAVDPQGNVTAAWSAWYPDRFTVVEAARREAGRGWAAPAELGRSNGVIEPRPIAVDPNGYVTAVWARGNALQSAVFDPVAPVLRDAAVPVGGVAGQPVAMSVDPFDVWSAVTTRWTFGDGASATGAAVRHCFSGLGERTVTITGTDAAGNVASATRTIAIAPAPDIAPGADPCAGPRPPDPPDPPDPLPPDPGPPGPRPPPEPRGPAGAPVVSGLRQTSPRWRTRAADRRPRLPLGTTFRFRLDRPAQVRFEFSQVVTGRRAGARCAKQTKANRGKRPCTRIEPRGTLRIAGRAGGNAQAFRGRIGRRTLAPGRYRLRVTAHADGASSAAAAIAFAIVR
jgi:PKD domain